MLNRLTNFFRSQPARPGFPLMAAPMRRDTCGVPYRRELTLELTRDHARLRELFGMVAQSYRDDDRVRCLERLFEFDRELRLYLADQGVRFESYMRYRLADDGESLRLMSRLRARLRGLSHYIHVVVQASEDGRLRDQGYRNFGGTIPRVGAGLQQVFECQQTLLFPLYRPMAADS
jgi:hypothetical protein